MPVRASVGDGQEGVAAFSPQPVCLRGSPSFLSGEKRVVFYGVNGTRMIILIALCKGIRVGVGTVFLGGLFQEAKNRG